MDGFFSALSASLVLLMLMSVGYFMGRLGWMTAAEKRFLSKFIVNIAVPCNCVTGLLNNLDHDSLLQAGLMVVSAMVGVAVTLVLSLLLAKQNGKTQVPKDIQVMSQRAGLMVKQAIAAYTDRDEGLAHAVINLDDEVDEYFRTIKSELVELIVDNREEADQAIDLIIIAKYLERTADHAVNIAQWAIFCVTGEILG